MNRGSRSTHFKGRLGQFRKSFIIFIILEILTHWIILLGLHLLTFIIFLLALIIELLGFLLLGNHLLVVIVHLGEKRDVYKFFKVVEKGIDITHISGDVFIGVDETNLVIFFFNFLQFFESLLQIFKI
eukprot:CAMPEP_0114582612 /NCGR_PEP_ID=MMETSP0125-20121206/6554_1 /TAXON_ID=485358 ORGANISM="Aristerostoma sp., Strain ATCC 50986" /NCGR_SAMPLE_ID=MMETSP0125 /ASSEMBLY_ACC=CAM_ASM_000245 /LENGTH=127 /DNA_ID=CAMNT_0001775661 /DNA_START=3088 /DNA_END=3471 /DNA_ORIENTATION=-